MGVEVLNFFIPLICIEFFGSLVNGFEITLDDAFLERFDIAGGAFSQICIAGIP